MTGEKPHDLNPHFIQVHIAKIDLPSAFHYSSCPRVCPHAFLRIVAKNDSAYALLGGSVDVFLDGNFCRKVWSARQQENRVMRAV